MSGTDGASETAPAALPFEIRVLGPVEIAWNGRPVDIGGVKSRALVARLLIDRGLVVSVDRLVDSLSRDHEGTGAEIALRSTISRVRKRLREAGVPGVPDRHPRPGLRAGRPRRGDRCLPVRASRGGRSPPALPSAPERIRPPAQGGRGPLARTGVQRCARRAVCPCRGPPPRGAAPLGRGGEDRCAFDDGRPPGPRQRAGVSHQRQPDAGAAVVPAHAGALPRRPAGRGAARLPGPPRHPRGRVGHRAGPRRRLVGARHPHPGARAPLPGPSRARRRPARHRTRGDVPSPPSRPGCPAQQRESPFVGRERESGLLRAWWASVRDGGGRLLLVDGDPGIGKTRLVVELARAVEEDGALVLWGRCDEDHVAPFQPVAEALGRYFQTLSADWISHMPDWQLTELSRLVVRLREYAPPLEEEGGDPESGRFRFFEAVTATLNELSADGTILLVVDNLHWADQPTLLLLRHILRSTEDGKLGVIAMYTDTEVPPDHPVRSMLADCRAAHPVETVHLRGLSPTAVEALARNWPKAPPDLVPQLCRLDRRQPALPRRAAAAVRGPRGRSRATRATLPSRRTSARPKPSASWWPGGSRGSLRT